jgi:hypothetical protein
MKAMETKRQKVSRYISDSRAEFQLQVLETVAHDAAVDQWLERLRYVPIEQLDECYCKAMENHGRRQPLIPKELLDVWQQIRTQPGFKQSHFDETKLCEFWCSSSGWILVNFDGDVVKEPSAYSEPLYVKPCPHHRPQGLPVNPQASTFKRIRKLETMDRPSKPTAPQPAAEPTTWKTAAAVAAIVVQSKAEQQEPDDEDDLPF